MLLDGSNGMKDRQTSKIKELAEALLVAGFVSLDEQANALGLSRSTTWTILKAKHKNYGLSAAVIKRLLRKPDLHSQVRAKIIEYVREKAAGSYGHNNAQLRRFVRHLDGQSAPTVHDRLFTHLSDNRDATEPGAGRKRPAKLNSFKSERVNHRDQ